MRLGLRIGSLVRARLRSRRQDERGAFAVLFAALTVMLLVLSAFTVDLGQAYVSKRQLQTAADAGVLAAGQVFIGQTMSCSQATQNAALKAQAQAAADRWAAMNRTGASSTPLQFACDADGGLTIDYGLTGTTPQVFGGLVTGHSTITTGRSAQVTIAGGSGGPMRPWGICSGAAKVLNQVVFVPTLGSSTTTQGQDSATLCSTSNPPGGWWVAQCSTGQGNGTGDTEAAVADGCQPDTTYTVVPQQGTHNSTPTALYDWMLSECPKKAVGPYCLSSDNGFNALNQTQDEWQGLVGQTFTMPVFCGKPDCSDLAFSAQGQNASYPIEEIASVLLCGFRMKDPSTGWPATGPCATANPRNYRSSDINKGAGFFLVITGISGGPGDLSAPNFTSASLTK